MKNHGVSNGLFLGAALVFVTLGLYLAGPEMFCKWWLALLLSLGLGIFFMARAGLATRSDLGGYMTFKEAIKPTFTAAVIALAISSAFSWIMYNIIDPDLDMVVRDCALETTRSFMEWMGAPEESIEEALIKAEEESYEVTVGKLLKQFAYGAIFNFIIAAIVSLIIKRKNPEAV